MPVPQPDWRAVPTPFLPKAGDRFGIASQRTPLQPRADCPDKVQVATLPTDLMNVNGARQCRHPFPESDDPPKPVETAGYLTSTHRFHCRIRQRLRRLTGKGMGIFGRHCGGRLGLCLKPMLFASNRRGPDRVAGFQPDGAGGAGDQGLGVGTSRCRIASAPRCSTWRTRPCHRSVVVANDRCSGRMP